MVPSLQRILGSERPARTLRTLLRAACCALVVLASLQATPAAAEDKPEVNFKVTRDQGVHYFRRKMFAPAVKSLSLAASTDEGNEDFRTHFFLARAASELLLLEKAFPAARRAVEIAEEDEDDAREEKASSLLRELESSFGGVTFRQDPDQKTDLKETYIHLKDTGGLINVRKKKVFTKISDRFLETRVKLPITLYLPFGKYTANGAPFEVKKGQMAESKLFMYLEQPGVAWWWYVGGAAVVAGGTAVALVLLLGDDQDEVQAARFEPMPVFPGE